MECFGHSGRNGMELTTLSKTEAFVHQLSSIQVPYKLRPGSSSKTRVDSSYNYRNKGIAEKPSMESCSPTQMKENY